MVLDRPYRATASRMMSGPGGTAMATDRNSPATVQLALIAVARSRITANQRRDKVGITRKSEAAVILRIHDPMRYGHGSMAGATGSPECYSSRNDPEIPGFRSVGFRYSFCSGFVGPESVGSRIQMLEGLDLGLGLLVSTHTSHYRVKWLKPALRGALRGLSL